MVNLTGRLSVAEVIALVGECDVFVGVGSGLLHAAAMFRKPVVGLFSHLEVTRRLTLAERFVAPQPALACFPCGDSWRWNVTRDGVAPPCRPEFRSDDPDQPPLDRVAAATPERAAQTLERIMRTVSSRTFGLGGQEALRKRGFSPIVYASGRRHMCNPFRVRWFGARSGTQGGVPYPGLEWVTPLGWKGWTARVEGQTLSRSRTAARLLRAGFPRGARERRKLSIRPAAGSGGGDLRRTGGRLFTGRTHYSDEPKKLVELPT